MLKPAIIPLLAIFAGHNQLETRLDLFSGDSKIGTGLYRETIDHKGHRKIEFHIWGQRADGTKVAIAQTKLIDDKAFPITEDEKYIEQASGPNGPRTETLYHVRYDDSGAAVFSMTSGKNSTTRRTYPPLPGYSRADASDLWFSKTVPLPGTTVTSTVFDIENQNWQVVETTFLKRTWITVGGRQIEANEVRDIRDGKVRKVYLDDKGQPVLMKNGQLRTEKHF